MYLGLVYLSLWINGTNAVINVVIVGDVSPCELIRLKRGTTKRKLGIF